MEARLSDYAGISMRIRIVFAAVVYVFVLHANAQDFTVAGESYHLIEKKDGFENLKVLLYVFASNATCKNGGMPFSFVFPSLISPMVVSKKSSVFNAGVTFQLTTAGESEAFHIECGTFCRT